MTFMSLVVVAAVGFVVVGGLVVAGDVAYRLGRRAGVREVRALRRGR